MIVLFYIAIFSLVFVPGGYWRIDQFIFLFLLIWGIFSTRKYPMMGF